MKKRIVVLVLSLLMMISLTGCLGIFTATVVYDALGPGRTYASALKRNWGLRLPAGYEEVYYISEPHPRGEGPRYCILRYEDEGALDEFRPWTTEDGATTYYDSYLDFIEEALNDLEVPTEFYPDCARCEWWYCRQPESEDSRDEMLILRSGGMLYIVEGFY